MRIIFDENIPEGLDSHFVGCECSHVLREGWSGISNGSLLKLIEESGFQVFLTYDAGIPHQHKMSDRRVAIFVLKPEGQGIRAVLALMPKILLAIKEAKPGDIRTISNRTGS